jgi:RNA polymerase sigma factor (sigma-70 family)
VTIFQNNRPLLKKFRQGEESALRTVFHFYAGHIEMMLSRGFSERKSNSFVRLDLDIEMRRELMQQVFIKAFSESARLAYDGIRSYRAYLSTIARNVIIDEWRRNKKDYRLAGTPWEALETISCDAAVDYGREIEQFESPEERIHWQQCLDATDDFISSLKATEQQFVKLRYQEELPQTEVAERLKLSRWKVRAMEKRIQARLKKHLQRLKLLAL